MDCVGPIGSVRHCAFRGLFRCKLLLLGCALAGPASRLSVLCRDARLRDSAPSVRTRNKIPGPWHRFAVSSALMYLTDGPTSPFYVFFIFISLAGALRWDWRGAIGSAALLAFVLVLLYLVDVNPPGPHENEAQDLSRAIVRG